MNKPIRCTTHFHACDCREYEFEQLKKENQEMKIKLNTCKNDYWFMTNLIEKYGSDKEQTLKDCLERMKFRKPMFNLSETPNSSKEGA